MSDKVYVTKDIAISRFEIESVVSRTLFSSNFLEALEMLLKTLKEHPEIPWNGVIITLRSYYGER